MRHRGASTTAFSSLCFSFSLLFALGCGSYLGNAQRAYQEGRYLEAAEKLGDHEAEVARLEPAKQANYGLYRGLSLLKLGDHDAASQWLGFAADIEKKRPGSLKPAQRRELEHAQGQLAKSTDVDRPTNDVAMTTSSTTDTRP